MAELFGQQLTKGEILARVGNIGSVAGITRLTNESGRANGLRVYEVVNEKMRFTVHIDKCMDLGTLYYGGIPLHFLAKPGQLQNHWYSDGPNAPRSISGGMLFTCGLNNVGPGQELSSGRTLPQHGYLRSSPAVTDGVRCHWDGDEYTMELFGEMREAELFGENLVLRRTITTKLGDPVIHIHDEIENEGGTAAPMMLMYHCNAGFPLLDEDSQLIIHPLETSCRDQISQDGMEQEDIKSFGQPVEGYPEQVFYHKLQAKDNRCEAILRNPRLGMGLSVAFDVRELPYLIQWKCRAAGDYVTGIEPSNCHPEGVEKEAQNGTLRMLAPGEIATTDLWLSVLND